MKNKSQTLVLPIGPLMVEHRLIERMVARLKNEAWHLEAKREVGIDFIGSAVDFFRFYADRCHHGKEEDILFRDLKKKELSDAHKEILTGLLKDHVRARKLVGELDAARVRYLRKDAAAVNYIKECLKKIVELYTAHIQKEDKQFFIPAMSYFPKNEQDGMLCEFWEFDRMLIHEKYKLLVSQLEEGDKK